MAPCSSIVRTRSRVVAVLALTVGVLLAGGGLAPVSAAPAPVPAAPVSTGLSTGPSTGRAVEDTAAPVVRTDRGRVRGVRADGVDSFRGIRYAAAPVGPLRWAPPRRAPAWAGVADATAFGNRCPAAASPNGPRTENEDCLFVNVQRPAGMRPGERRPVYVFIHGGGLVNGSSNDADSAAIVRQTGAVAVTFNYRLGALGFLGLPELTKRQGGSGNYGLQDQQAALRWVQRSIGGFGGDRRQVTVGGESAGGWSVCTHLVAPGSRGLLSAAMIQSGSCPSRTQSAAEAAGVAYAPRAGCPADADVLACLRGRPVGALLDAMGAEFPTPVRGTPFLPDDPRQAVAKGRFARVPVVIGATRDEGRTFTVGNVGMTREGYLTWLRQTFGTDAPAVRARYPWPTRSNAFTGAYLTGAVLTDSGQLLGIGGCTNRSLTKDIALWTPTWAYEFAHRTGPGLSPEPVGYEWGAGHAAELAYLFPGFDVRTPIAPTFDAGERELARRMKLSWGAFTLTHDPNVPGQGWWPRFDRTGGVVSLRSGSQSRVVSDARIAAEHRCAFWDGR